MEPHHSDAAYALPPAVLTDADGVRTYPNVTVAAVLGYRPLCLDLRIPAGAGPWPVIVYVHGGAWWEGSRRRLPSTVVDLGLHERMLRRGYAVALAEYRLSREAAFPAQLHDVKAAIRWLRAFAAELGLDPARIAVWGESAGGHLAALAGLTSGAPARLEGEIGVRGVSSAVQAVVDWYGVAVLPDPGETSADLARVDTPGAWLFGGPVGERRAAATEASPVAHVHASAPPFLCMHGTADKAVPYAHSELLATELRKRDVRCDLYPVPGADHIFEGAPDVAGLIEASIDFLDDVFGRQRPNGGATDAHSTEDS